MAEDSTKASGAVAMPAGRLLDQGKRQFIIGPRRGSQAAGAGLRPMPAAAMRALVGQLPGLEIVRVLRPRRSVSAVSVIPDEATEVYVVRIDPDSAELIRQMMPPRLVLEEDAPLEYATPTGLVRPGPARLASWSFAGAVETRQMRFRITGEGDKPLANVGVSLTGEGFPQEGRTDKKGEVTMPLIGLPGKRAHSFFAASPSNYWDRYLTEPELLDGELNVVRLRPIDETIAGFPAHYRYGWGQLQMGLDRVSETLGGKGVKVAIVDSGVDTTHPLLRHIRVGLDLTSPADPHAWTQDVIGHGSHAAGIIAARDDSGKMLRGFVPDAEIHVLKVSPGGRLSSLLEALDYCLEREIDIVNLSVGTLQPSLAIEQKLEEAALHGIACIVGAGSSGGPVQYPASSPYTLAIGAVGRLNEYPDETWDATTVLPNLIAADGIFSPSFSCAGPEVAVCAPGVAIVSTVPGGFEPQSGTSTAAPHVTGLATLLLAHHPAFQGPLRFRSQQRVVALYSMIRWLCVPYGFGAERTGAGLPRLHAVEQILQASPTEAGQRAGSTGNGRTAARHAAPEVAVPGMPLSPPIGGVLSPMAAATLAPPVDAAHMPPLYVQPALVAQAWPVQALLESLRRQYLGN
jgi:subtilisin family serine protease